MERKDELSVDATAGSHLVVTVHGIQTYGHWQERLEYLVTAERGDKPIEFVNYKLGYFSIFAFMVPFSRWLVVRRFRNELLKLSTQRPRDRIDLVGHSFGTHVIGWAVARLPKETGSDPIVSILTSNAELFKLIFYAAPFVLLFLIYFHMYQNEQQQRSIAEQQRNVAEQQRSVAEQRLIATLAELATGERLRGNLETALRLAVHAARLGLGAGAEMSAPRTALAIAVLQSRVTLSGPDWVNSAVFNPDGARVVSASIRYVCTEWAI